MGNEGSSRSALFLKGGRTLGRIQRVSPNSRRVRFKMSAMRSQLIAIMALSVSVVGFGCAGAAPQQATALSSGPETPSAASSVVATGPAEIDHRPTVAVESSDNAAKLESLWNTRMAGGDRKST